MKRWWLTFSKPRYVTSDGSAIDVELVLADGTRGQYTAARDDIESNGRMLYAAVKRAGNVAPYQAPDIPVPTAPRLL